MVSTMLVDLVAFLAPLPPDLPPPPVSAFLALSTTPETPPFRAPLSGEPPVTAALPPSVTTLLSTPPFLETSTRRSVRSEILSLATSAARSVTTPKASANSSFSRSSGSSSSKDVCPLCLPLRFATSRVRCAITDHPRFRAREPLVLFFAAVFFAVDFFAAVFLAGRLVARFAVVDFFAAVFLAVRPVEPVRFVADLPFEEAFAAGRRRRRLPSPSPSSAESPPDSQRDPLRDWLCDWLRDVLRDPRREPLRDSLPSSSPVSSSSSSSYSSSSYSSSSSRGGSRKRSVRVRIESLTRFSRWLAAATAASRPADISRPRTWSDSLASSGLF